MKALADMTLAELWQLFPIFLKPHDPEWKVWYNEEVATLEKVLPNVTFAHIGSTAVDGIWAKPIVDILVLCPRATDLSPAAKTLEANGYIVMARAPTRISCNKGYTPAGFAERVFHAHIRIAGDCDEIYFRDYLNAHPDVAKVYETLKLSLWKRYEHDRDGYTAAKTDFVLKVTARAKTEK